MSEATSRLVTFRAGEELYAVDVAAVERVLRYTPSRPVPRLPLWLDGVIEHAGRVVPVADLRARLGARIEPVGAKTRLLLITFAGGFCAMIVDQVLDVRPYNESELEPAPAMVRGLAGEFVRGVVSRNGALVLVIDLAGLLSAEEHREIAAAEAIHA
jgi:purine-binding chemotaxis protein CheW